MPDALAPQVLFRLIGYHSASVTTRLLAVKLLGCDRLCQSVSHPSLSHKSLPQALKRSLRSDCPDSSIHRWRGEITGGLGLEPQLRKGRRAITDGGEQVERGVRWSDQKRREAGRMSRPGPCLEHVQPARVTPAFDPATDIVSGLVRPSQHGGLPEPGASSS